MNALYNYDQIILSLWIQNLVSRPKQIYSVDDGDLSMIYDNCHCYYRHCHKHT